jgi:hypothetical protein
VPVLLSITAISLFMLLFAVGAAVYFMLPVVQIKNMAYASLYTGDAARIFAFYNINQSAGQRQLKFMGNNPIFDNINRGVGVHIAQHVKIQVYSVFYFDNIFFAQFFTARIHYYRDAAIKFVQPQVMINVHRAAGFYVINHNALIYTVYRKH